jgi:hypothetical protein
MFDYPLKQYALFQSFEQQVEARVTSETPETLALNPYAKAYLGAIRLVLGEEGFAAIGRRLSNVWCSSPLPSMQWSRTQWGKTISIVGLAKFTSGG